MTDWSHLPHAPAPGTALAALAEIAAHGREFVFGQGLNAFRLLVLPQADGSVSGFVNRCPHYSLPLNVRPGEFLTRDGTQLMCRQHLALFDRTTGACLGGACEGAGLTAVPLALDARGHVVVA